MTFLLYQHDPAHSFGSVSGDARTVEFRRTFSCSECFQQFPTEISLSDHISEFHPIHMPAVTFEGKSLPAYWIVRRRLSAAFQVHNATRISLRLNDRPVPKASASTLSNMIEANKEGVIDIVVANRTVESVYRVVLRIADAHDVDIVTNLFMSRLAHNDVTVHDVRRFSDDLRCSDASREYASGLADYVYGVLAKDGAGEVSLPFATFREKFHRARSILSEFDNALASAACAAIQFNLNDFTTVTPTGVAILDQGSRYFADRAAGVESRRSRAKGPRAAGFAVPLCPIDSSTDWLLRAAAAAGAIDPQSVPALPSDEDRTKAAVLVADRLVGHGDAESQNHLQKLQHDAVFGRWATELLKLAK